MVRYAWALPSGFKMRLRASQQGVGIGNPIQIFGDESGYGNYGYQGTVSAQPTLQSVSFGRLTFNVARFDTVDDGMTTTLNIADGSPFSVFALWRPANPSVTTSIVGSATRNWMIGTYSGGMLCYFGDWSAVGSVNGTDFVLLEVRVTPGQLNGSAFINGRETGPGGTVQAPLVIALGASGANAYPGGCDLAELIMYDRLLTDKEAVQLRRYFQATYNFMKV